MVRLGSWSYHGRSWLKWPCKKVRPVFKAKSDLGVDSTSVYKNEVTQVGIEKRERMFCNPMFGPAPTTQFGIFFPFIKIIKYRRRNIVPQSKLYMVLICFLFLDISFCVGFFMPHQMHKKYVPCEKKQRFHYYRALCCSWAKILREKSLFFQTYDHL